MYNELQRMAKQLMGELEVSIVLAQVEASSNVQEPGIDSEFEMRSSVMDLINDHTPMGQSTTDPATDLAIETSQIDGDLDHERDQVQIKQPVEYLFALRRNIRTRKFELDNPVTTSQ